MSNKKFAVTHHNNHDLLWYKSPLKNKKYRVDITKDSEDIRTVDFGDTRYQHYKDTTPLKLYSDLDHKDTTRRDNYRKRHSQIKLKDGRLSYKVKFTPAWFSYNYLW
jgi:hypothetical protein